VSSLRKKSCMEGKRGRRRLHACSIRSVAHPASTSAPRAAAAFSSISFATLIGACWAYDSCMFWMSCGVKWRPFLADKRGFLGAEQSINFTDFAFLGVVGGIFSSFSCDRGLFQGLIERR
jgi:hypothetical protein